MLEIFNPSQTEYMLIQELYTNAEFLQLSWPNGVLISENDIKDTYPDTLS